MGPTRRTVQIPWRAPLSAAHAGPVVDRELVLVARCDQAGVCGHGEVAELPGYLGSSVALAERAGADMAQWDLRARRAGVPLWSVLGAPGPIAVVINATIGADEPATAAAQAAAAVSAGYSVVKVKVGVGDDVERVRAIRSAIGPAPGIRIDANGAWSVDQAVDRLTELAGVGLELCEEPVHGASGLAAVAARVPDVPLAADESVAELLSGGPKRACGAVCLKVARGGITALLADARRARSLGYEVYLASTLDGPLGIAAALHAAAVILPERACGLATLGRFARASPIPVIDGHMSPPSGVGLGDGLLDFYES